MVTLEDFKMLDLRVGEVKNSDRVEGSDKLLRLLVDFGTESRQNLAGVGKKYQPEELLNKQFVFVFNLESRTVMGFESQGMVLAAHNESGPILIEPVEKVENGNSLS